MRWSLSTEQMDLVCYQGVIDCLQKTLYRKNAKDGIHYRLVLYSNRDSYWALQKNQFKMHTVKWL